MWVAEQHAVRQQEVGGWGVHLDAYGSTATPAHHARVQSAYRELLARGAIAFRPAIQFLDPNTREPLFERRCVGLVAIAGLPRKPWAPVTAAVETWGRVTCVRLTVWMATAGLEVAHLGWPIST